MEPEISKKGKIKDKRSDKSLNLQKSSQRPPKNGSSFYDPLGPPRALNLARQLTMHPKKGLFPYDDGQPTPIMFSPLTVGIRPPTSTMSRFQNSSLVTTPNRGEAGYKLAIAATYGPFRSSSSNSNNKPFSSASTPSRSFVRHQSFLSTANVEDNSDDAPMHYDAPPLSPRQLHSPPGFPTKSSLPYMPSRAQDKKVGGGEVEEISITAIIPPLGQESTQQLSKAPSSPPAARPKLIKLPTKVPDAALPDWPLVHPITHEWATLCQPRSVSDLCLETTTVLNTLPRMLKSQGTVCLWGSGGVGKRTVAELILRDMGYFPVFVSCVEESFPEILEMVTNDLMTGGKKALSRTDPSVAFYSRTRPHAYVFGDLDFMPDPARMSEVFNAIKQFQKKLPARFFTVICCTNYYNPDMKAVIAPIAPPHVAEIELTPMKTLGKVIHHMLGQIQRHIPPHKRGITATRMGEVLMQVFLNSRGNWRRLWTIAQIQATYAEGNHSVIWADNIVGDDAVAGEGCGGGCGGGSTFVLGEKIINGTSFPASEDVILCLEDSWTMQLQTALVTETLLHNRKKIPPLSAEVDEVTAMEQLAEKLNCVCDIDVLSNDWRLEWGMSRNIPATLLTGVSRMTNVQKDQPQPSAHLQLMFPKCLQTGPNLVLREIYKDQCHVDPICFPSQVVLLAAKGDTSTINLPRHFDKALLLPPQEKNKKRRM